MKRQILLIVNVRRLGSEGREKTIIKMSVGGYAVLLLAFFLIKNPQTRLWLLIGAIGMIAETSAYFAWSLGVDLWRDLEDNL
jgi:hypothetical protein